MSNIEDFENKPISVFIVKGSKASETGREFLGKFPLESDTFTTFDGRKIRIDISGINQRMRGEKYIEVEIDEISPKQIGVSRRNGVGYQTIGKGIWLGVSIENPKGILSRPKKGL